MHVSSPVFSSHLLFTPHPFAGSAASPTPANLLSSTPCASVAASPASPQSALCPASPAPYPCSQYQRFPFSALTHHAVSRASQSPPTYIIDTPGIMMPSVTRWSAAATLAARRLHQHRAHRCAQHCRVLPQAHACDRSCRQGPCRGQQLPVPIYSAENESRGCSSGVGGECASVVRFQQQFHSH